MPLDDFLRATRQNIIRRRYARSPYKAGGLGDADAGNLDTNESKCITLSFVHPFLDYGHMHLTLTQDDLRDPQNHQALCKNWRISVFRDLLLRAVGTLADNFDHESEFDEFVRLLEPDVLRDNVGFLTLELIMDSFEHIPTCIDYEVPDAAIKQGLLCLIRDEDDSAEHHGVYFFQGEALIWFRDTFAKYCGYCPLLDTLIAHRDLTHRHARSSQALEYPLSVRPMYPDSIIARQAADLEVSKYTTIGTPQDLH